MISEFNPAYFTVDVEVQVEISHIWYIEIPFEICFYYKLTFKPRNQRFGPSGNLASKASSSTLQKLNDSRSLLTTTDIVIMPSPAEGKEKGSKVEALEEQTRYQGPDAPPGRERPNPPKEPDSHYYTRDSTSKTYDTVEFRSR